MSAKARDEYGRWRYRTICIKVSPEENDEVDALRALSGMTKQDYCVSRLMKRDIVVVGNPKVYKALKGQMERICMELERLNSADDISPETMHILEYVAQIYEHMKN